MRKYQCIGGPFDGQFMTTEELWKQNEDYSSFNCSSSGNKSKADFRRAKARGFPLTPTMVFIHQPLFKDPYDV